MVVEISLIADTESSVAFWMPADLLADLARGLRRLFGQRLHFGGDHCKATTGLAGARRLDGRVERQQIGLAGDGVDQFDHVADACRGRRQFADAIVGIVRLRHGFAGDAGSSSAPDG